MKRFHASFFLTQKHDANALSFAPLSTAPHLQVEELEGNLYGLAAQVQPFDNTSPDFLEPTLGLAW